MHSSQLQVQRIAVAAANDLASHEVFDASIFPGVCLRKQSTPGEPHPQRQHVGFGATTPQGTTGGQMFILRLFSSEVKTFSFHSL